MRFSLIVPTLNEHAFIENCITWTHKLDPAVEIIVADGGSTDGTPEIALGLGARVCRSQLGRGTQCNSGAAMATGDVLVFLHADTRLADGAFSQLRTIFARPDVQCGTFRVAFDGDHWFLRFLSLVSCFDLGLVRFGDQGLAVRKRFFDSLGRYRDWKLFEDLEIVQRARRRTKLRRFPIRVTTSARRFLENGIIRQQLKNTWYTLRYLAGASPDRLANGYEHGSTSFADCVVIVMARYPRLGHVKTRLAALAGDEIALGFHRASVECLVTRLRELPKAVVVQVWYTGGTQFEMGAWLGHAMTYLEQPDGDLGARLSFAFDTAFASGARKVLAVAGDVPELSAGLVLGGLRKLDRADLAVGPTADGGYYLIGLRQPCPELFRGVSWGTGLVCRQTLNKSAVLKLKTRLIRTLQDIDTLDDLLSWQAHSRRLDSTAVPLLDKGRATDVP